MRGAKPQPIAAATGGFPPKPKPSAAPGAPKRPAAPRVNTGVEGETAKQVLSFDADAPVAAFHPSSPTMAAPRPDPRRGSGEHTPTGARRWSGEMPIAESPISGSPTHPGNTPRPRWQLEAPLPHPQWSKSNSKQISGPDAKALPRFDITHAAEMSCSRAVELLECLGVAWPHDYAICYSRGTGLVWLLARAHRRPELSDAAEAHLSFSAAMQRIRRSSGSGSQGSASPHSASPPFLPSALS